MQFSPSCCKNTYEILPQIKTGDDIHKDIFKGFVYLLLKKVDFRSPSAFHREESKRKNTGQIQKMQATLYYRTVHKLQDI